jgi:large subunit ribosomal protein L6
MSRVGRMPITVPKEVSVKIEERSVTVKGPKGELNRQFNEGITVKQENSHLLVSRSGDDGKSRALHGLSRALLANMVEGVTKGFESDKVVINVGYSHPVELMPVAGVTFTVEGNNRLKVIGIDKELVGEVASKIVAIKPHDDYKGKGIRYAGSPVHLKPGKAGKAIGRK